MLQWKIPHHSYQTLDSSFWKASVPRVTFPAGGPIKIDLKTTDVKGGCVFDWVLLLFFNSCNHCANAHIDRVSKDVF